MNIFFLYYTGTLSTTMIPYLLQVFAVLSLLCCSTTAQSYNDTNTLINDLMGTYTSKVRPVETVSEVLNISLTFYLSSIISFDEQEESLTTAGYLRIMWKDRSLVWQTSQYNGVAMMFVPQDDIWKPDISLRNSFSTFTGLGSSYQNVIVENDGTVYWDPFQVMKSTCSVDITYYPYDTQQCTIKLIAWSYLKSDVNLLSQSGIIKSHYSESSTWKLVKSTFQADNSEVASISYTLMLERKPRFYVFNMILPVILLSILNLFTFVLPLSSGERASYGITVFLALVVFLTIVAAEFPKNSDTTSHLAVWLILMVSISTLAVILTIIEARLLSRDDGNHEIGKFYRRFYGIVMFLQCRSCKSHVHRVKSKAATSKQSVMSSDTEDELYLDLKWKNITDAMDYVFFFGIVFFVILVTLIMLLTLIYNPDKVTEEYKSSQL
ncbi:acetylcholine receptor subunit gamma-like [Ruditapes philippinarum]|uniref:acetylcholine receptor subunit gamma-like n=1 Tax=Ruditapes philippinarum TaxID=129788 RepID=UPI00295A625A|nr:acetylcholine receptor subunit gamma-like [Ruditapes philippinarum]